MDAPLVCCSADRPTGADLHTVLVVEDEPPLRELMADVLRDEGYAVEEAEDGAEAIRLLGQHRPGTSAVCVVLLDMMLPEVDGIGVLRHLAAHGTYIPVVAMSASRERLAEAMAAGARTTVPKPFDLDQLLAVVARNCGHQAG
jgi:CheY-like chemotaxis protein